MSNKKENLSPSEKIAIGNEELAKSVDDFFKEPTIFIATLLLGIFGFTDELGEYRMEAVRLLMKLAEKTGIIPEGPDKAETTVNLEDLAENTAAHSQEELKAANSNDKPVLILSGLGTNVEEFKEELEKTKKGESNDD